jgi:pyruvate/2-oxoglutarate dehydrogenase complex dihydrolipoamide acyltransferase (E2) component
MENDEEMDREIWIRKTKVLYPEVEDWVIEMAVDAWLKNGGEKVEIDEEVVQQEKDKMFKGLEYSPYKQ